VFPEIGQEFPKMERAKMNKCGMMRTVKVYEEKYGK